MPARDCCKSFSREPALSCHGLGHTPDLRDIALGDAVQCRHQIENSVVCQAVVDELAVAPCRHQTGAAQVLQMLLSTVSRLISIQNASVSPHANSSLSA